MAARASGAGSDVNSGGNDDALVFDGSASGQRGQRYCRSQSGARAEFGRELLALYGKRPTHDDAVLFPSGMAAIGAAIASLATAPAGKQTGKCLVPRLATPAPPPAPTCTARAATERASPPR